MSNRIFSLLVVFISNNDEGISESQWPTLSCPSPVFGCTRGISMDSGDGVLHTFSHLRSLRSPQSILRLISAGRDPSNSASSPRHSFSPNLGFLCGSRCHVCPRVAARSSSHELNLHELSPSRTQTRSVQYRRRGPPVLRHAGVLPHSMCA